MRTTLLLALCLAAAFVPAAEGTFHDAPAVVPDRAYVLVMQGSGFNGMRWPDTPLLEAFVGERVSFTVLVPPLAEAHTFHLHGHPWPLADGRFVDTFLLGPGDVHRFDVVAGGLGQNAGDWMYHCHVDMHVESGMWGVFRVYPFATRLEGSGAAFEVALDRLGDPLDGATLALALDGAPVPAHVTALGGGRYAVHAAALAGATGALEVRATHPGWGESVARATLGDASPPAPVAVAASHGLAHAHS